MPADQIQYSEKYFDAIYEYRHVILPPDLTKYVPKSHLMTESEWRNLGVQQSPGWVHYMMHAPEPHVILFRRPRTDLTDMGTSTISIAQASTTTASNTASSSAANSEQQQTQANTATNVSVHG